MSFQSADMGGISSRRMRYAVAASLLLHFLLLWPEPLPPPASEARGLLQATVRSAQLAPDAELARPKPAGPQSRIPEARSAPMTPAVATLPKSPLLPLESVRTHSVPPPVITATDGAAMAVPAAAAAPSPTTRSAGNAAASDAGSSLAAAPGSGEALDGLRTYRLAVASQARRFKRYPAEARASGWSGSTEVRLEVGAEGLPRAATVARSSGHEALDRAALAMIDAGAQHARLPDSLRGRGFAVLLPVVYNLDAE